MEKFIKIGKRVLRIGCSDKCMPLIYYRFFVILNKKGLKSKLIKLMDDFKVPSQILINFRKGKGDLYGLYYINEDEIAKRIIVIDIYTKSIENGMMKNPNFSLDLELLDTFVHELVHYMCDSERKTMKITNKFMKSVKSIMQK